MKAYLSGFTFCLISQSKEASLFWYFPDALKEMIFFFFNVTCNLIIFIRKICTVTDKAKLLTNVEFACQY